jgi:hypothetical protein
VAKYSLKSGSGRKEYSEIHELTLTFEMITNSSKGDRNLLSYVLKETEIKPANQF